MSESDNITRNLLGKLLRTEISIIRSYRAFLMLLPIHGSSSYQSGSPLLQRRLFGDGFGTMTDNAFEVETRPGSFLVPRSLGKEISWDNFLWLLSMVMVFCNYVNVEWMIIGFMALAFFGKGIGALGWAVMADTAPKEISGLSGGLFNMFGNISGIVTPIAIGYIVGTTGSFNGALIYVGVHALIAVLSYLVLVGDIKRIELKPVAGQ